MSNKYLDIALKEIVNHEVNKVLDKIRAEIQENINYNKKMNYQGIVAGLLLTLDIIDKYRESEDIGDYPNTIPNQFDNLTGSMNI